MATTSPAKTEPPRPSNSEGEQQSASNIRPGQRQAQCDLYLDLADVCSSSSPLSYRDWLSRRWPIVCLLVAILTATSAITFGWNMRLRSIQDAYNAPYWRNFTGIVLEPNLVAIDPDQQTAIIDWWVLRYTCSSPDSGSVECDDVSIYFQQTTFPPNLTANGTTSSPALTIYGGWRDNSDPFDVWPTFRTSLDMTSFNTQRTFQSYPFDKYRLKLFLFAINSSSSVPISLSDGAGIATGFDAKAYSLEAWAGELPFISIMIEVTHGLIVRIYALFIVFSVWIVTLTLLGVCISAVFLGRGVSASVLVLPVSTLFAVTSLRATLPGAPAGFGAVTDYVGLLPCLAILTFCAVFTTAIFLFRNPELGTNTGGGNRSHGPASLAEKQFEMRQSEPEGARQGNNFATPDDADCSSTPAVVVGNPV
ncbi:hypothetical protein JAAARDRAFT_209368 [Jaapia argillacea MUCL 33604]|uniref:Transmembrane protein n=1 Tax=Jaapia argillacea MUCL 33604 TaxID=933084 RepID=A0A067PTU3_9AGAM|nr:hypothetical protein JAAARDRAFT_209368 [Jaapia argillacea MUCL 33604]